jgi:hypothetical protein
MIAPFFVSGFASFARLRRRHGWDWVKTTTPIGWEQGVAQRLGDVLRPLRHRLVVVESFAEETILSVAILAFGFSLLLYLSVTFIFWRRGAPWANAQLAEWAVLSPVGSGYIAVCAAGLITLLGWPAMQFLDFSSEIQTSVVSFLKFNYLTVSGVAGVLLLIVVLMIRETNNAFEPWLGRIIAICSTFGGRKRGIR